MTPFAKVLRLGRLVQQHRERAGLTRRQLADQALLALDWLRDLESGAHLHRLLRLLAHPAMAELLADWLRLLTAAQGGNGHNGHNGRPGSGSR